MARRIQSWIRNPKGIINSGGKWELGEQDKEDFEQEERIREWLKREGRADVFVFPNTTGKGTARNTLIKGSISLDQKISDSDGPRTYADLIGGCVRDDLADGYEPIDARDQAEKQILWYLSALGFDQGVIQWLTRILKQSALENRLLFEKSAIDLEW